METRVAHVAPAGDMAKRHDFPGLAAVARVESQRGTDKPVVRTFLLSKPYEPERLLDIVRFVRLVDVVLNLPDTLFQLSQRVGGALRLALAIRQFLFRQPGQVFSLVQSLPVAFENGRRVAEGVLGPLVIFELARPVPQGDIVARFQPQPAEDLLLLFASLFDPLP